MTSALSASVTQLPRGSADCHAHVMQRELALVAGHHSRPIRDVEIDEYLAVLDAHGLTYGVLVAPSFYGHDNSLLLQALAAAPGRLAGTVILDADAIPHLGELDLKGVRGVRLNWLRRGDLPDCGSSGYRRLFAAVRERGWHVELCLEGERIPDVLPALLANGVSLVVDHFGCPEPEAAVASPGFLAVLNAVREGRTWVKLSAPYRLRGADPRPYVDALMAAGGPERLVWASDWPWVGHEDQHDYLSCLGWLALWIPDEAARRTVLVETPADLFRFDPPERNASPSIRANRSEGESR